MVCFPPGALASVYTVYRLSRISGLAADRAAPTGYAVGSLLAAGLAMAMYLSGAALRQIFTYLLGSFDAATWSRFAEPCRSS
jgi:ABC-type Fe3+-siderophore transport system permease subunit